MSALRHIVLAYLLLVALIFFAIKSFIEPVYNRWQANHQTTQALREDVLEVKSKLVSAEQKALSLVTQLGSLVELGYVSYADHASDAAHSLQQTVKPIFAVHGVDIVQLRPSNELLSDGLSKSRLELDFRAPMKSLQPLLSSLSQNTTSLHIELISLRNNSRFSDASSSVAKSSLEGSLSLVMWYIDESLSSKEPSATSAKEPSAIKAKEPSAIKAKEPSAIKAKEPSVPQANVLAGLFDLNARLRFNSPSLEHYRLAAVNLSQNIRIAIIANTHDGKTRRLRQGELLDAWRVESIDPTGVRLMLGDRSEVLKLRQ